MADCCVGRPAVTPTLGTPTFAAGFAAGFGRSRRGFAAGFGRFAPVASRQFRGGVQPFAPWFSRSRRGFAAVSPGLGCARFAASDAPPAAGVCIRCTQRTCWAPITCLPVDGRRNCGLRCALSGAVASGHGFVVAGAPSDALSATRRVVDGSLKRRCVRLMHAAEIEWTGRLGAACDWATGCRGDWARGARARRPPAAGRRTGAAKTLSPGRRTPRGRAGPDRP